MGKGGFGKGRLGVLIETLGLGLVLESGELPRKGVGIDTATLGR